MEHSKAIIRMEIHHNKRLHKKIKRGNCQVNNLALHINKLLKEQIEVKVEEEI